MLRKRKDETPEERAARKAAKKARKAVSQAKDTSHAAERDDDVEILEPPEKRAKTEEQKAARKAAKTARVAVSQADTASPAPERDDSVAIVVPKKRKAETNTAESSATREAYMLGLIRDEDGKIVVPKKQKNATPEQKAARKAARKARKAEAAENPVEENAAGEADPEHRGPNWWKGGRRPEHWAKPGFKARARPGSAFLEFFPGGQPRNKPYRPPIATMDQICHDCGLRDYHRYRCGLKEDKAWVLICHACYEGRKKRDRKSKEPVIAEEKAERGGGVHPYFGSKSAYTTAAMEPYK